MNNNPTELRGISERIIANGITDSRTSTTDMVDDIFELVETKVREAIETEFGGLPYKSLALKATAEAFK